MWEFPKVEGPFLGIPQPTDYRILVVTCWSPSVGNYRVGEASHACIGILGRTLRLHEAGAFPWVREPVFAGLH